MHDFGKLAYLDVHKTGSTYVSNFLNNCCTLQQVRYLKHDWIRGDYRQDCFYFITVRNPVDMWSSLYRYGLDGKGDVFNRLHKAELLSAYYNFNNFMSFCLDEENANLLGFNYSREISNFIGFMSFRFLKLSLQYPMKQIQKCIHERINLHTLESNFITNFEIKNERLSEGLSKLSLEIYPQYFDADKVKRYVGLNLKINESRKSKSQLEALNNKILEKVYSKEWLLMSRYQ